MNRRHFLQLTAAALAASRGVPALGQRPITAASNPTSGPISPRGEIEGYFRPIVDGFLRNARRTSPDLVVCDFPGGTMLKSCSTPSGKTYVSVARMLTALVTMRDNATLGLIFRHAFDPAHPDFWGYAPPDRATQRTVESALVADALARCDRQVLRDLTPEQRGNIQKWLASCTQVPERKTNHAWFTAMNHAARLELSREFPEFEGDEAWMIKDLKALDGMFADGGKAAAAGSDGWSSDAPDQPIYDYYNFYVFPYYPLMWGRIIGKRYPEWNEKFRGRVRQFLEKTPYFFAADGSYPLMGRSLLYRWSLLTPLVMGYQEKLWPHAPGLLRRIVRRNLAYHWNVGAFDEKSGKLRETFSADGTAAAREGYIDNGHPYWCMPAFVVLEIPDNDPFWTAPEEPLPVEQGDYLVRFEGPRMLLSGRKHSGEVRWLLSMNSPKRDVYRDKYIKFSWSSHFPFNASADKTNVPPDQALVFRDRQSGAVAVRDPNGVKSGRLLADGVESVWRATMDKQAFEVTTQVRLLGDYELRTHRVSVPAELVGRVEVFEGGYALHGALIERSDRLLASPAGTIALWRLRGYGRSEARQLSGTSMVHRDCAVLMAHVALDAAEVTLATLHYASPKPPAKDEVFRAGDALAKKWAEQS